MGEGCEVVGSSHITHKILEKGYDDDGEAIAKP